MPNRRIGSSASGERLTLCTSAVLRSSLTCIQGGRVPRRQRQVRVAWA
jgi:hypothetical protein